MTRYLPRPAPLALALSLMFGGSAVWAQSPANLAPAAAPLDISIPAQPLGDALNAWARQTGTQIAVQQSLVVGKSAPAVAGKLTARQALDRLLTGSGLMAVADGNSVLIRLAPPAQASESVLPVVTVTAGTEPLPGELSKPYAGGQVARGGSLGLLGNSDVMNTPFSQSSYTSELIKNTQAQTLGEVLEASPAIRRSNSRFGQNDIYVIRGFSADGRDIAIDGLNGLTNVRRNAIEAIERVEVFRGPSALLNGVPPVGSIGGSINMVLKRPTAQALTDLTLSYTERSQLGAHLDLSRRFGTDNRFGIRVNASQREGETTFDYNKERASLGAVALDYQGDRLRLYANLIQDNARTDGTVFAGLTLAPGLAIPPAPDNRRNFNPPFVYTDAKNTLGVLRAEYDFNDKWTASLGYGQRSIDETQLVSFGQQLLNSQGDFSRPTTNRLGLIKRFGGSTDAKLNGSFATGPVNHKLAVGLSRLEIKENFSNVSVSGTGINNNFYNPNPNAEPIPIFPSSPIVPTTRNQFDGIAVADTLEFAGGRVALTLGARHQTIRVNNATTGVATYDRSATSPAVGFLFKPWNNWSLYGNYIEGLSQGPTAPTTAANANQIFPPFVTKQGEVGVKYDTGSLITTVALFEIKRPSQITDILTNIFSVDGEQRNRGVEWETYGELAKGLRVIGGATYIDAKLTKTQGGVNQGKVATAVPEYTANLSLEWDTPAVPGLTLTGRALYTDKQFVDASNTLAIPSWTRIDFGARYALKVGGTPVTLRANLTNVLNSNYYESTGLLLGVPRTFALSATFSF